MSNSPLTETFKKLLFATDAVLLHYSKQHFMVPFHLPAYKPRTHNSMQQYFTWILSSWVCLQSWDVLTWTACLLSWA